MQYAPRDCARYVKSGHHLWWLDRFRNKTYQVFDFRGNAAYASHFEVYEFPKEPTNGLRIEFAIGRSDPADNPWCSRRQHSLALMNKRPVGRQPLVDFDQSITRSLINRAFSCPVPSRLDSPEGGPGTFIRESCIPVVPGSSGMRLVVATSIRRQGAEKVLRKRAEARPPTACVRHWRAMDPPGRPEPPLPGTTAVKPFVTHQCRPDHGCMHSNISSAQRLASGALANAHRKVEMSPPPC